jgi:hypothetical protein
MSESIALTGIARIRILWVQKKLMLPIFAFLAMAAARPLYLTPDAPVDDRVADLLALMTQSEKIAQLILPFGAQFPSGACMVRVW